MYGHHVTRHRNFNQFLDPPTDVCSISNLALTYHAGFEKNTFAKSMKIWIQPWGRGKRHPSGSKL